MATHREKKTTPKKKNYMSKIDEYNDAVRGLNVLKINLTPDQENQLQCLHRVYDQTYVIPPFVCLIC